MQSLTRIPNWVLWKKVQRRGKWTKQPITTTGAPASINTDRFTLEAVMEAYLNGIGEGVGFIFTEELGIVGIDVDDCFAPGLGFNETAKHIIEAMNSYTEVSPSGLGIHILIKADYPRGKRLKEIEVYGRGRFFTVSWSHLEGTPLTIEPRQEELTALLEKFRQPTKKHSTPSTATQTSLTVSRTVVGQSGRISEPI